MARDLETALKNSFTKGRAQHFPTFKISFKLKNLHDDSFRCVNNSHCIRIENGAIRIPKVGKVPIILHRKLSSKIKSAKEVLSSLVGYDINSQHTVVGSNRWYVKNPKSFKKSSAKQKHA